VYVETPGDAGLSQAGRDQVARILQLAEELGARVTTLPGQNVADTILDYARQHNITKVIAGKPVRPRWLDLLRGTVVDRLILHSRDIDIYVISGEAASGPPAPRADGDVTIECFALRFVEPAIKPLVELVAQLVAVHRFHSFLFNPACGKRFPLSNSHAGPASASPAPGAAAI